jgi:RNA polymerase sigma factor (sigma-70 family)
MAGDRHGSPAFLVPGRRLAPGKVSREAASNSLGVTFPQPSKLLTPIVSLGPLSAQSDARLVELVGAGNERAFEALARRYRRQLLIYATRLLGNESRAEDALQQGLMQAWIALRDGADVAEVRPWLYRIVHNSAVTMLRRARHDTVELNEALDAAAPEPGPESRLVLKEIFAGISVMPEPQRQAILLTAVAGNSHGETAAALGLSDGAVRGLVYRARTALRQAAAALSPAGLWNWFAHRPAGIGGRRAFLAADAGDVAGAAGTAAGAAVVMKGGAILAAAGALAGAGQAVLPTLAGPDRQAKVVHHQRPHPPGHPVTAVRTVFPTGAALTRRGGDGHGLLRHESHEGGSGRSGESSERHGANGDRGSGRDGGGEPQRQGSNGGGPGPSNHEGGSGNSGPGTSTSSGSTGSGDKSSVDGGSPGGSHGSGGGGVTSGGSGGGGDGDGGGSSGSSGSRSDSGGALPSGGTSGTSGGSSGSDGSGQPAIAQSAPSPSDPAVQIDGGSGGSDGSGGGSGGG